MFGYLPQKDISGIKSILLIIIKETINEPIPDIGRTQLEINLLVLFFNFRKFYFTYIVFLSI